MQIYFCILGHFHIRLLETFSKTNEIFTEKFKKSIDKEIEKVYNNNCSTENKVNKMQV